MKPNLNMIDQVKHVAQSSLMHFIWTLQGNCKCVTVFASFNKFSFTDREFAKFDEELVQGQEGVNDASGALRD